ncbi:MAG: pyridoxal phosphate-dependent aminotransferase [Cyclobacteriaceae bacterium]
MVIATADRLNNTREYYFSVKLKEVRGLMDQGHPVINMGIGSPDLPPSPNTIAKMVETVQQPDIHGYQPYKGIAALRKAIASWYHQTYQVNLDPEHEILPLMGSKEGITHLSLTYLNPGDPVLVPELGYPSYRAVSEMVGAKVIPYPMLEKTWHPDFAKMQEMDLSKVKIMWINYPHMPSGAPASKALFEQLVAFAHDKKILLCHDNPYSLILAREKPISLLSIDGAREISVEMNSMSKSHNMAGWRVGWMSGKREYLDEVIKIKSNIDSGMFYGIQNAAVEAFKNDTEWHLKQNEIYNARRVKVYQFLDKLGCNYDKEQVGLFAWAKVPDQLQSVEKLIDHLLYQYHLFISPGFIFGQKGERYIRMSLCNSEAQVEEALIRIRDFKIEEVES